MKPISVISLLLLLALSCTKEPTPPAPEPETPEPVDTVQHQAKLGQVTMYRNGEYWGQFVDIYTFQGSPNYCAVDKKTYYPNLVREQLTIYDIPCTLGRFTMAKGGPSGDNFPEFAISWVVDGDQFAGGLLIDTSYTDNYLEVTRYDSLTNEIEGRFECHLSKGKVGNPASIGMPTTMHIADGRFYLKLE